MEHWTTVTLQELHLPLKSTETREENWSGKLPRDDEQH